MAKMDPLIKVTGSSPVLAVFLGGEGAASKCLQTSGTSRLGVTCRFHRERADQGSCKSKAAGRDSVSVLNKMKFNPKRFNLI